MSDTLINSLFIFDCPLMAFSSGVKEISSLINPTIKFDFPSNKDSTAATPILLAKTLSKQEGLPPLCKCPKTETLTSY